MRAFLPLFILTMIASLGVAHATSRKLKPHTELGHKPNPVQRIAEPRQVKAVEAYTDVLEFDEEFTGWKVQRFAHEDYELMRARVLSDMNLPSAGLLQNREIDVGPDDQERN